MNDKIFLGIFLCGIGLIAWKTPILALGVFFMAIGAFLIGFDYGIRKSKD